MSFRVTARTLIHLGAELISSDAVALFELVKNAFDAKSPYVTIEVIVRIPHQTTRDLIQRLELLAEDFRSDDIELLRADIASAIDSTTPDSKALANSVEQATDLEGLRYLLEGSNYLTVADTGEGMSLDTLSDVFLTIGTRSRLETRQANTDITSRAVLGEKGVGRLSAMRLGTRLRVESTTAGEPTWNVLAIDWSVFSHDSDALLEAFHLEPRRYRPKEESSYSGTRLFISGLPSPWTKDKLEALAKAEFTKLTDPFTDTSLFPVQLLFNHTPISIPRFNSLLLNNAHATVKASFVQDDDSGMRLLGKTKYKGREEAFSFEGAHFTSTAGTTMHRLKELGPFEVEVYWYNRRILTALEAIGDRRAVLRIVGEWGGGIMVFRDGFRVLPYGGPNDDWLDLDRRAFASSGYKINRTQVIGRLLISTTGNPALTDQTNREGLRDSEEKRALIALLRYILQIQLRTFLDAIDKEDKPREPILLEELDERVEEEERQIQRNIRLLVDRVPEVHREQSLVDDTFSAVARLRNVMTDVRDMASSYQAGRGQLLNLAGIGLAVEVFAHELNRATEHVLRSLADASHSNLQRSDATWRILVAQLGTLQRRLCVLDPLSTAGRQRKEVFNIVEVTKDAIEDYQERFRREDIACLLIIEPDPRQDYMRINAVKRMIIQIVGNLIDNSVYWLRQQRILDPQSVPLILVTIDTEARQLSVTDNGPGIRGALRERVFDAFFTTKPVGHGKGLGLFIGREVARYNGADLYVAEAPPDGDDTVTQSYLL